MVGCICGLEKEAKPELAQQQMEKWGGWGLFQRGRCQGRLYLSLIGSTLLVG